MNIRIKGEKKENTFELDLVRNDEQEWVELTMTAPLGKKITLVLICDDGDFTIPYGDNYEAGWLKEKGFKIKT